MSVILIKNDDDDDDNVTRRKFGPFRIYSTAVYFFTAGKRVCLSVSVYIPNY